VPVITNIEDLRILAERRVPRMFYDYADSGSWTESTYRANSDDFARIKLRQRVAVNMENRSLASTMVGLPVSMPVAHRAYRPDRHAACRRRDPCSEGGRKIRRAVHAVDHEHLLHRGHGAAPYHQAFLVPGLLHEGPRFHEPPGGARPAAKCSALVLTLDLQILGQRHKDLRNGLTAPPKLTLKNMMNMATKPGWCMGMLGTKRRGFGNIVGHATNVSDMSSLSAWTAEQFDPRLSWGDVEWLRQRWGGKLIIKGIMDPEDARMAAQSGADALIVSNHGGRQLDGAESSINALPAIMDAVGDKMEVHLDGGIGPART
jgi:L-lactate dehydrogenase (cytochrome)